MSQPPVINKVMLDSLDPITKLFTKRGVNLASVGVRAKGTSIYVNGNREIASCDAFVLTADNGGVAYPLKEGATITFYRQLSHKGPEVLCLIEDLADQRTFTITGDRWCKIRDVKPERPRSPLPPSRLFNI